MCSLQVVVDGLLVSEIEQELVRPMAFFNISICNGSS